MVDKDYEDYKDFDMSGATRGIHPLIKAKQKINGLTVNESTKDNSLEMTVTIQKDIAREFNNKAKLLGKTQQQLLQEAMAEYLTTH